MVLNLAGKSRVVVAVRAHWLLLLHENIVRDDMFWWSASPPRDKDRRLLRLLNTGLPQLSSQATLLPLHLSHIAYHVSHGITADSDLRFPRLLSQNFGWLLHRLLDHSVALKIDRLPQQLNLLLLQALSDGMILLRQLRRL